MLLHNKPDYSRTSEQTTVSPERHELAQHRCSGTVDSALAQLTTTIHVDRTITKSSAMLPSDQTPIDTACTRRFFAQALQWPNVFKPAERCRRHPSRLTRPAQRTAAWSSISLTFLRWCFKPAGLSRRYPRQYRPGPPGRPPRRRLRAGAARARTCTRGRTPCTGTRARPCA